MQLMVEPTFALVGITKVSSASAAVRMMHVMSLTFVSKTF